MAEFDLTTHLGKYLDRHLVFPLIEFLSANNIYDENELLEGKLELLSNTNMVDFAMDVHRTLYQEREIPPTLHGKRIQVVEQFTKLQAENEPVRKIFEDPEFQRLVETSRDSKQLLELVVKRYDFKPELLDTVYEFAKLLYECGNYSGAAEYLYFHRLLVGPSDKHFLNGLWGKLASEILMQNWETALEDLNRLKDFIDNNSFGNSLQLLHQRTWLIHWSLFVYFNHPKGRELIIEMFLYQQQYLNAIQTTCPHILRYLATAVIINKQSRRTYMKDLIKVIQQESYTYKDPITEFLEHLYVKFDFDGAQQKLKECETVLNSDFFLVACAESFIENARLMIFETFCRIHQCISIKMIAEKLHMTPEEAERWIVNLIRNARLDAKIDSKLGHVIMGTQAVSPYHQLIEKTKTLTLRSQMLAVNIEKKLSAKSNENWGHDF